MQKSGGKKTEIERARMQKTFHSIHLFSYGVQIMHCIWI